MRRYVEKFMGERKDAYRVLVGKPERRCHWEDPDLDRRIILQWLEK
jgi:hypothetical protein